jgi:hypothetical protein
MVSGSGYWLVEDEYEKWVNGVCDLGTEHSPNHRGTRLHSPTHRWRNDAVCECGGYSPRRRGLPAAQPLSAYRHLATPISFGYLPTRTVSAWNVRR